MFDESSWKSQTSPINRIKEDVIQVRLPLPYALNHVNVYLIRGSNGWTIVDTGLNYSSGRQHWEEAFAELKIGPNDVEQIIVSHMHPDHFGLAGWLQARFSHDDNLVPVYVSPAAFDVYLNFWEKLDGSLPGMIDMLVSSGLSRAFADDVVTATLRTGRATEPHPQFQPIPLDSNGQVRLGNRCFDPISAPGHEDGQLIFYDPEAKLMLSGDQILMKITPNIALWQDTESGVLQRYLDSLRELSDLNVSIGLPGHKWLIADWQGRIAEMFDHHDARLRETYDAVGGGTTIISVSQAVFRLKELDVHQSRFALVETRAHLDLLERRGEISQTVEDGVWRYFRT